ncbi:MAG: hypothetical protein Q4F41_16585 [Eubacteriales bacterium]|nr:hypothetical protein [Eubacteriales bacterium]
MKRTAAIFLSALLLCGAAASCQAGEAEGTQQETQTSFGILATYQAGEKNFYTAPVENGKAQMTLPDGTRLDITDLADDSLTLVVYPIPESDREAWEWIRKCMGDRGTTRYPFEIYFVDQEGNRVSVPKAVVTIALPETVPSLSLYGLGTDEEVQEMSAQAAGNAVTFTLGESDYYVFVEKAGQSEKEEPTEPSTESELPGTEEPTEPPTESELPGQEDPTESPTESEQPKQQGSSATESPTEAESASPKTSDESPLLFWWLAMLLSGLLGGALAYRRKRG